jgi:hypothetical protein
MTGWLDPVRAVLDGLDRPVTVFVRDDDAGWGDQPLHDLLDLLDDLAVPLDLAAIPAEVTPVLAAELAGRARSGRSDLVVHQHGWRHVNHQQQGRSCEFGADRDRQAQHEDLLAGRRRMADLFGDAGDAFAPEVFTPPWNRCTDGTGEVLRELGFTLLSRDRTAGSVGVPGLTEVPVTVDWFATVKVRDEHGGVARRPVNREQRGDLVAAALKDSTAPGTATGLMLHHAVTGATDLADLRALLEVLTRHPQVVFGHLHRLGA